MEKELIKEEGVSQEPVEGSVTDEKGGTPMSAKDKWLSAVKAKYGDLSEDELYTKVGEDFDAEKTYASGARAERQKLQEAMDANPDVKAFIEKVGSGASVSEAAGSIPADLPAVDAENMAAMEEEGRKRVDEAEASMAKLKENLDASKAVMEEYFKENNIGKEEADELTNAFIQQIATPISEGLITKDAMQIIAKGLCYDKHRVQWEEAGRIAGRNDKIEEERRKFNEGIDGLPKGQASSGVKNEEKEDPDAEWIRGIVEKTKPHPFFQR